MFRSGGWRVGSASCKRSVHAGILQGSQRETVDHKRVPNKASWPSRAARPRGDSPAKARNQTERPSNGESPAKSRNHLERPSTNESPSKTRTSDGRPPAPSPGVLKLHEVNAGGSSPARDGRPANPARTSPALKVKQDARPPKGKKEESRDTGKDTGRSATGGGSQLGSAGR